MKSQAKQEQINQEQGATEPVTRRAFTKVAVGAAGLCYAVMVGYPIYQYLYTPVEKASKEAAVKEVLLKDAHKLPLGSGMVFKFGSRPAWLIHNDDDTWIALDAVCTHLGCTVKYEQEINGFTASATAAFMTREAEKYCRSTAKNLLNNLRFKLQTQV
jgi:cytochrome b6-f complex iron-sulfur subunit